MDHADTLRGSVATARTHLEDLQAEIEAGARCADRIHADASAIDTCVESRLRRVARMSALVECADELKASIAQQQAILREIRASLDRLRHALRGWRADSVSSNGL